MTRPVLANRADRYAPSLAPWADAVHAELVGNILPFWPRYARDPKGGFFGLIHEDLRVEHEAPRGSVLAARILWTYAAAVRLVSPVWRATADWALTDILTRFWDRREGGLYWMIDAHGAPVAPRKQTYAQAFGIYGLAEYHRATGSVEALEKAKALYRLVEKHCYDPVAKGYFEARGRAWDVLDDVRLSEKDLNAPKSMNTHLHVLEAYTNLFRVWPDDGLRASLGQLLAVTLDRIVDERGHFRLFFETDWTPIGDKVSFGHDIEGSWLLFEAAEILGDAALLARAKTVAVQMAQTAFDQALDADGSMLYEADGQGQIINDTKHWWVQAEAVVGFTNAYEITGREEFLIAAQRSWEFIDKFIVDRVHGEWHAKTSRYGVALTEAEDQDAVLAGPWKCPYHNARLCYEVTQRLGRSENHTP